MPEEHNLSKLSKTRLLGKLVMATDLLLEHERLDQNEGPLPEVVDQFPEAGAYIA